MSSTNFNDVVVVPFTANTLNLFGTWNYTNFKCESDVDLFLRHEQPDTLTEITVRGVAVRYVNIGTCALTFTATGMFSSIAVSKALVLGLTDPTSTGDFTKNRTYYGGFPAPKATADGRKYLAAFYFNPVLTDFDYQIKLNMIGDGTNQFQIEAIYVIGDSKEYPR